ncbi:ferrous iron transport protein A [Candidatus Competibacter phosphatis]|uniref:Ferrous iron transport protein A n=1 Tax=Candidatus Competibacter phosphatis TaxID=221280 RepID=A0ABX1TIK8_9GAMM|nr:FeoA domain-containing protein [Candidatus Competibacter phosphatis]NMQ18504.1 ferrous iron transport protein A [Candidatus Competibacter phosphatis]
MNLICLSELAIGQRGVIEEVETEEQFRWRLQALGFRIGREVRLIRQALFGGPLQVRIGSVNVMLRRHDAAFIHLRAMG